MITCLCVCMRICVRIYLCVFMYTCVYASARVSSTLKLCVCVSVSVLVRANAFVDARGCPYMRSYMVRGWVGGGGGSLLGVGWAGGGRYIRVSMCTHVRLVWAMCMFAL